jgi:hypothetical protein
MKKGIDKMKEVIYYEANDGARFNDEDECRNYEFQLALNAVIGQFTLADEEGNSVERLEDAYFIGTKTEEAALFIQYWGEEEGLSNPFDNYNDLTPSAGHYYYSPSGEWRDFDIEYERIIKVKEMFGD